MNEPQFKIYGKARREKKKTLSGIKSFVKNFWRSHQLEKDMGGDYVMSDERAEKMYNDKLKRIKQLELELSIKY